MVICPANKCTGCYACINACAQDCITMQEDEYGELHPVVDENSCLNCNLCIKSCPNNINLAFEYPKKCFASWISDRAKRKTCASGGIGTVMSEFMINHKNGIVFGSRYNENFTPIITYTEKINELEKFKGSRYVQSVMGKDIFKQVKLFLKNNRFVLFIGTPCQVAGLLSFLRKPFDNLVTVDLICHGVCPTKYFKEEINYITKNKGLSLKDITDVRFRGNDRNDFCLSLWVNNSSRRVYRKPHTIQYYLAGFLLGVSMRENCYSCNYARPERISDITIGDFIGLGKTIPFSHPKKNVSSVTLNTKNGRLFYEDMAVHTPALLNIERDYKERLEYKPSLVEPFHRHKFRPLFLERYLEVGYLKAIREVLRSYVWKNKTMSIVNLWRMVYKIPRRVIHMTLNVH